MTHILKEDSVHFLGAPKVNGLFLIKEESFKTPTVVKIVQKMEKQGLPVSHGQTNRWVLLEFTKICWMTAQDGAF